jgi:glucose-6-phosphate-specific signal transduction histidine kinase
MTLGGSEPGVPICRRNILGNQGNADLEYFGGGNSMTNMVPVMLADRAIDFLQEKMPQVAGLVKRAGIRWPLRVMVIVLTLVIIGLTAQNIISPILGKLARSIVAVLPHYPQILSFSAVVLCFLVATALAWYKDYDSGTYGLIETLFGLVTVFSFLPPVFQDRKATLETLVGVIGGLYLISEGFSLILEAAKKPVKRKADAIGAM